MLVAHPSAVAGESLRPRISWPRPGPLASKSISLLVAERAPRGFDETLSAEQGGSATLGELVSDLAAQDDFLHVVDRIEVEELHELTGLLGERERGIVSAHYGLGCPAQTLREIAGRLGVSVERVRQLEERALARSVTHSSTPRPRPSGHPS